MPNKNLTSRARKTLLRRGRGILRLRQDAGGDAVADEGTPDYLAGLSEVERDELTEIHAALERIERGIFGRCEHCCDPIEVDRIESTPWVRRCERCDEQRDRAAAPAV